MGMIVDIQHGSKINDYQFTPDRRTHGRPDRQINAQPAILHFVQQMPTKEVDCLEGKWCWAVMLMLCFDFVAVIVVSSLQCSFKITVEVDDNVCLRIDANFSAIVYESFCGDVRLHNIMLNKFVLSTISYLG